MEALKGSLSFSGKDFCSFEKNRTEFEKATKKLPLVFDNFSILHFEQNLCEDEYIRFRMIDECLIACMNSLKDYNPKSLNGIRKDDLPDELAHDILCGNITTAIRMDNIIFFCDMNCIAQLAAKAGIKGKFLYERSSYMADLFLYMGLKTLQGEITGVLRYGKGFWRLMSVFSTKIEFPSAIDITSQMMELTGYDLVNWEMTQYQTNVILENPKQTEYIAGIQLVFSDTGEGLEKRFFTVRNADAKRSVILGKFSTEKELFSLNGQFEKSLTRIAEAESTKRLSSALNNVSIKKAIGEKRINKILENAEIKAGTERDLIPILLHVPDTVGNINSTSDLLLRNELGKIFSKGFSIL